MFCRIFFLSLLANLAFCMVSSYAAEFATKEEAVAMVKRIQEKYKKDGYEAVFKAVTDKPSEFHDRDLYASIYDYAGNCLANGGNAKLVNTNQFDLKDEDGKFIIRGFIDVAKSPSGKGWIEYRWTNFATKKIEYKYAYIEQLGNYLVTVGVYRQEQPNENTISIISGSLTSDDTYLQVANDLASVLNDGDRFS